MKEFEVVLLADAGIGNAIEALYAVEYCIANKIKTGIFLNRVNASFQNYLRTCYGEEVVLRSLENCKTRHLIHSFTYQEEIRIAFQNYFYIQSDNHSSKVMSETEQYLSVVQALYPSGYGCSTLMLLKEERSDAVRQLSVEKKYVFYPGGSAINPTRRWPGYEQLMKLTGKANTIWIGGKEDLDFRYSYVYPRFLGRLLSQKFLNSKALWTFLKGFGLLRKHSFIDHPEKLENLYIEKFSWGELVSIFKHCKKFIGNDGGLMHLAGASGAKGLALFGPTSPKKNKTYNPGIKPLLKDYPCQPCQFGVADIQMVNSYINCPYEVKCLKNLTPEEVIQSCND